MRGKRKAVTGTKTVGLIGGALAGLTLGLTLFDGLRKRKAIVPGGDDVAEEAAKVDTTILEQHILRMAMHKKPLPPADMQRAVQIAGNLGLAKTVATLQSIINDGKIGGPTYIPLPVDEKWPGTDKGVRRYINEAMAKLSKEATA